jgi:hypothetical protein
VDQARSANQEEIDTGTVRSGTVLLVDASGRKIAGNVEEYWKELRLARIRWMLYPERSTQAVPYALPTVAAKRRSAAWHEREDRSGALIGQALSGGCFAIPLETRRNGLCG